MLILAYYSPSMRGFTLVETLTVLAIGALLVGLAAANLGGLVGRQRVAAISADMANAMTLARNEAMRRGVRVSVCRTTAQARRCAGAGASWNEGWLVFIDSASSSPPQPNNADAILRVYGAIDSAYQVQRTGLTSAALSFAPNGRLKSGTVGVSFDIKAAAQADGPARCVVIATTGRIRMMSDGCS